MSLFDHQTFKTESTKTTCPMSLLDALCWIILVAVPRLEKVRIATATSKKRSPNSYNIMIVLKGVANFIKRESVADLPIL